MAYVRLRAVTTMPLPANVRDDFPILHRRVDGKPLVYLDSAATSQKPRVVLDALRTYYEEYNANVHRALYRIAERATVAYEDARRKVAGFVGGRPEEVVFTRGTTEAINLVAYAYGRWAVGEGDEILLTEMEHHSNLVPWQILAAERGARLRFVPVREDGTLDLAGLDSLLTERTRIVALTQQSNVVGTINPVREIADRAHAVGAVVVVDGAQSVPHMPVDVAWLGCDFLAFSGHKMCGPTGIGALWGRYDLLERMPPFHGGGEMIERVELERSTYKDPPHKFEAGTPNIADAIALGVAVDYLQRVGRDAIREHEKSLTRYALAQLQEVEGVRIYGPRDVELRGGAVAFDLEGVHPHDVAQVLDSEGVCVRAGHHCAQPLHRRLGVQSTARASLYLYNTTDDIDALVRGLEKVKGFFGIGRVAGSGRRNPAD